MIDGIYLRSTGVRPFWDSSGKDRRQPWPIFKAERERSREGQHRFAATTYDYVVPEHCQAFPEIDPQAQQCSLAGGDRDGRQCPGTGRKG